MARKRIYKRQVKKTAKRKSSPTSKRRLLRPLTPEELEHRRKELRKTINRLIDQKRVLESQIEILTGELINIDEGWPYNA